MSDRKSTTIHKLIVGTFTTDLGVKMMEQLEGTFVNRPIYVEGLTLDQVAYRQGQADLVNQLKKELNNG